MKGWNALESVSLGACFFFCWGGGGRGFGRLHSKALCLRILLGLFFRMASCLVLKYVLHRENMGKWWYPWDGILAV